MKEKIELKNQAIEVLSRLGYNGIGRLVSPVLLAWLLEQSELPTLEQAVEYIANVYSIEVA